MAERDRGRPSRETKEGAKPTEGQDRPSNPPPKTPAGPSQPVKRDGGDKKS